jgi:hypothetical protein
MSMKTLSGSIAAAWLACGLAAGAQTPASTAASAADQATTTASITVTGCVQPEISVLKRDPAAGAAGMGDEFVLTNARLNAKASAPAQPQTGTPPPPDAPVGTSGAPGNFGKVYRTTGDKESELKALVGQRVEITGAFKNDEDAKAELAVGTSGRPVTGALTAENTPEITIAAIKPVPGACSAAK